MLLFAPTEAPPAGQAHWLETKKLCETWAERDHLQNREWKQGQTDLLKEGEEKYNRGMRQTLANLVGASREASKSIAALEQLHKPTVASLQTTSGLGFNINMELLNEHIYVVSNVVLRLDNLYLKHYGSEGVLSLSRCFSMMESSRGPSEDLELYQVYLAEVKQLLRELSSSPGTTLALEGHDLRAFGLKHAEAKLEPLFGPIFGRICLPLPTRSMLDDLRGCLDIDKDIITEVWFYS